MSRRLQDTINTWSSAEDAAATARNELELAKVKAETANGTAADTRKAVTADLTTVGGRAVKVVDGSSVVLFQLLPGGADFEYITLPTTDADAEPPVDPPADPPADPPPA